MQEQDIDELEVESVGDDSLSDDIDILKKRLCRRMDVLDYIRRAYLRDVIIVKETLIGLKNQNINLSSLDSIPSLDLTFPLKIFAPHDCEVRMKACEKCGGYLDIVHTESTKIEKLQKLLDDMYVREETARIDQAEVQNTLDKVNSQYSAVMYQSSTEKEILLAKILRMQEEADKFPPSMMSALQTRVSNLMEEHERKQDELVMLRLELEQFDSVEGENRCLKTQLETMELRYDAASKSLRETTKKLKSTELELGRNKLMMIETSDRCKKLENEIRSEYQAREKSDKQTAFMRDKVKELRRSLQSAESKNGRSNKDSKASINSSEVDWYNMVEQEMASYISRNFPVTQEASTPGGATEFYPSESNLEVAQQVGEATTLMEEKSTEFSVSNDENQRLEEEYMTGDYLEIEEDELIQEEGERTEFEEDNASVGIAVADGTVLNREEGNLSKQSRSRTPSRRTTASPSEPRIGMISKVDSRLPSRESASKSSSRVSIKKSASVMDGDCIDQISVARLKEVTEQFNNTERELKVTIQSLTTEISSMQGRIAAYEDDTANSSKLLSDYKERAAESENQVKQEGKKMEKKLRSDMAKSKHHNDDMEVEIENHRKIEIDTVTQLSSLLSNLIRSASFSVVASAKLEKLLDSEQKDAEVEDSRQILFENARRSFGVHVTQVTPLLESLVSYQTITSSQVSAIFSSDSEMIKKMMQFSDCQSATSLRTLNDFFGSIDMTVRSVTSSKREIEAHHAHEHQRMQIKLESNEKMSLDKQEQLKEKIKSKDEQIKDLKEVKLVKLSGEVSQLRVQVSNITRLQDEKTSMQLIVDSLQKQMVDKSDELIRGRASSNRLEKEVLELRDNEIQMERLIVAEKQVSANLEGDLSRLQVNLSSEIDEKLVARQNLHEVYEKERIRLETNVAVEIDATAAVSDASVQTEFLTPDFSLRLSYSGSEFPSVERQPKSLSSFISSKLSPTVFVGPPLPKKQQSHATSRIMQDKEAMMSNTLPTLITKKL